MGMTTALPLDLADMNYTWHVLEFHNPDLPFFSQVLVSGLQSAPHIPRILELRKI